MSTLLELMLVVNSTVLVLSMNVAAIVIQIASTRFSSQVSTIFFQSYFLMFCLFLFLFNNLNTLVRCRSVHCGARWCPGWAGSGLAEPRVEDPPRFTIFAAALAWAAA